MLYKFESDWNKNSKWLLDKKYVHEKELESNHCAKNVLQCRILKASKTDVNGAKVQTTAKYIQFDAWARTGTNRCNAKTGIFVYLWYKFHFNENWIVVAIYGIQKSKTKTCFFFPKLWK